MKARYELEVDPLAVSLTKPPTKFGVPLFPFYLSILCCLFAWMIFQVLTANTNLFSILGFIFLWVVFYGVMAFVTFRDPFGLILTWINILHFRKHATHTFWGNTDSYAP